MKKTTLVLALTLFSVGCTHTQVLVKDSTDAQLTCTEIATQTADVKNILRDIDDKTGFSGRNVAMGVLFWPGVIVNQMNAGDARKAATERLTVLVELSEKKNCQ